MSDFECPTECADILQDEKLLSYVTNIIRKERDTLRDFNMQNPVLLEQINALKAENEYLSNLLNEERLRYTRCFYDNFRLTKEIEFYRNAFVSTTPMVEPVAVAAPTPVVEPVAVAARTPVVEPVAVAARTPVVEPVAVAAPTHVVEPVAVVAPTPVVEPESVVAPKASLKSSKPSGLVATATKNGNLSTNPHKVMLNKVDCFLKYLLYLHEKNSPRTTDFIQRLSWAFASGDKKNENSDAYLEMDDYDGQKVIYNDITFGLFIDGLPDGAKLYNKTVHKIGDKVNFVFHLTEDGANHLRKVVSGRDAWDNYMKVEFTKYVKSRWGNNEI